MNVIESFNVQVLANQTQNIEIQPSHSLEIVGVMVVSGKNGVMVSLRTANSEQIIDSVDSRIIANRSVEWGKNYIPVSIASQRLFLRVENNTATDFSDALILIYNAQNPTDRCY